MLATNLVFSGTTNNWNISCPSLLPNMLYTAVIAIVDDQGNIVTTTNSFDTFSAANYTWEAEDFDYGGGHFIDNPQTDAEIPLVAQRLAKAKAHDAVICLGAVIRGSTPHFDYVAAEVSKGIAHVSLESGVPILFGVLTTDTLEQAVERAGSKAGNKGYAAAESALEMINLLKDLGD